MHKDKYKLILSIIQGKIESKRKQGHHGWRTYENGMEKALQIADKMQVMLSYL